MGVCGGVLQITFNGVQKDIENLGLESLVASKITLQIVCGCYLEFGVRQEVVARKVVKHLTKPLDQL